MRYDVYGIPNCNTVKKAIDWLKQHNIEFEFHNYKKEGVTSSQLTTWAQQVGYERLVNKKGTTWKLLDDAVKTTIVSEDAAIALMQEKNSVIKRPLIALGKEVIALGFDETDYQTKFLK